MKIMSKEYLVQQQQVQHVKHECSILQQVEHPFIISLRYAFQNTSSVRPARHPYRAPAIYCHSTQQLHLRVIIDGPLDTVPCCVSRIVLKLVAVAALLGFRFHPGWRPVPPHGEQWHEQHNRDNASTKSDRRHSSPRSR